MTLIELSSNDALSQLISSKPAACVTFSAHWCGPCKASKPQLEQLAQEYSTKMTMGIVYESDLGDSIHNYSIRAFPTYVLFVQGKESKRVEGVNLAAVKEMMDAVGPAWEQSQGSTLGGDGAAAALSPEEARLQRLAKLGGGGAASPAKPDEASEKDATTTSTDDSKPSSSSDEPTPMETEKPAEAEDVEMETEDEVFDPAADLNPESIKTLTESMGFPLVRAQKGLLFGGQGGVEASVEGAVEWLTQHQDDEDIDEPIKFVKPLTPEEKAAKIERLKAILKAKRDERNEAEKVDNVEREKQRRFMGQEMAKTRESMEVEQRKREAQQRKREKDAFKKERARLRAELAKDKAERQANQGKLSTKLGVDGYNPDGVQYDVDNEEEGAPKQTKKPKFDAAKIDEYIAKVSGYRAGGDGGKCLKVLLAYVGNAADKPDEDKFKQINMDNKAFKSKVKPFIGAKQLLMAVGFKQPEGQPTTLVLSDPANYELLSATKAKLQAALEAY